MDYSSFQDYVDAFDEILKSVGNSGAGAAVMGGVQWIGGAALAFMLIKSVVGVLASGGERSIRGFEDVYKPLLLFLALIFWGSIMSFIDMGAQSISNSVEQAVDQKGVQQNITQQFIEQQVILEEMIYTELLADRDENFSTVRTIASGNQIDQENLVNLGSETGDDIVNGILKPMQDAGSIMKDLTVDPIMAPIKELKYFINDTRIQANKSLSSLGITIQNFVSILFYAYAGLILEILKIVGAIALVLSFWPNMSQSFFSWLRNFISVHLWFAVAAMVFTVVDLMYLKTVELFFDTVKEAASGSQIVDGKMILNGNFEEQLSLYRKQAWLFIGFGIIKGILMFKIPNIVSMFVGSSSSAGGMFGAVFAPIKIASSTTKQVAGNVSNVATKGGIFRK